MQLAAHNSIGSATQEIDLTEFCTQHIFVGTSDRAIEERNSLPIAPRQAVEERKAYFWVSWLTQPSNDRPAVYLRESFATKFVCTRLFFKGALWTLPKHKTTGKKTFQKTIALCAIPTFEIRNLTPTRWLPSMLDFHGFSCSKSKAK